MRAKTAGIICSRDNNMYEIHLVIIPIWHSLMEIKKMFRVLLAAHSIIFKYFAFTSDFISLEQQKIRG